MITRFRKWGFHLSVIIYTITLVALLIWIKHLTPIKPAEIATINLNKAKKELILSGHHLTSTLSAVITPNMQRQETTVSTTFTWGKVLNLARQNDHIWLANGSNGILSYNITNPAKPILKGILPIHGKAWNIAINGNNAFIAGGSTGMFGVDITAPAQPRLAFAKYSDKIILDVATLDGVAIVITVKSGIIFLNTHHMDAPEEITTIPLDGALQSITIHQHKAYVLGVKKHLGILHVIDIDNPYQPKKLATLELPTPCWDSTIIDSKLLVAMGKKGVYSIDIDNPALPFFIPQAITKKSAYGLSSNDNNLLVSSNSKYVHLFKSTNNHLTHVKTFLTADQCRSAVKYKDYIVVTIGKSGFSIIDSSKKGETIPVNIEIPITAIHKGQMAHQHGTTCVTTCSSLHLLQTTANGKINKYATVHFKNKIQTLIMDQQFAYASLSNHELHIINLAPTAQQRIVSISKLPNAIHHLSVQGEHLYLSQHNTGLFVVNIAKTDQIQISTEPLIAGSHTAIAIKGSLLYMATKPNGFKIYRLNNLGGEPTIVGELLYPLAVQNSSTAIDLAIHNGYAFITNGNRGVLSIDIRNPEQPKVSDSLDLSGFCTQVKTDGNYAYITLNNKKVTMIDISDPTHMKILCELAATKAVSVAEGKLLKLSDKGISICAPIQPLTTEQQSSTSIRFNLPQTTSEGYYDLQLATQEQLTTYSNLLHYSPQHGWDTTRTVETDKTGNN